MKDKPKESRRPTYSHGHFGANYRGRKKTCDFCRQRRVRCEGFPCQRCMDRNIICTKDGVLATDIETSTSMSTPTIPTFDPTAFFPNPMAFTVITQSPNRSEITPIVVNQVISPMHLPPASSLTSSPTMIQPIIIQPIATSPVRSSRRKISHVQVSPMQSSPLLSSPIQDNAKSFRIRTRLFEKREKTENSNQSPLHPPFSITPLVNPRPSFPMIPGLPVSLPGEAINELLQLFFLHIQPIVHLFHPPMFYKKLSKGMIPPGLLCSMVWGVLQHSSYPEVKHNLHQIRKSIFATARDLVYAQIDRDVIDVPLIQTVLCFIPVLTLTSDVVTTIPHNMFVLECVRRLGMLSLDVRHPNLPQTFQEWHDREEQRRIVWCIFAYLHQGSEVLDITAPMHFMDVARLQLPCDDMVWYGEVLGLPDQVSECRTSNVPDQIPGFATCMERTNACHSNRDELTKYVTWHASKKYWQETQKMFRDPDVSCHHGFPESGVLGLEAFGWPDLPKGDALRTQCLKKTVGRIKSMGCWPFNLQCWSLDHRNAQLQVLSKAWNLENSGSLYLETEVTTTTSTPVWSPPLEAAQEAVAVGKPMFLFGPRPDSTPSPENSPFSSQSDIVLEVKRRARILDEALDEFRSHLPVDISEPESLGDSISIMDSLCKQMTPTMASTSMVRIIHLHTSQIGLRGRWNIPMQIFGSAIPDNLHPSFEFAQPDNMESMQETLQHAMIATNLIHSFWEWDKDMKFTFPTNTSMIVIKLALVHLAAYNILRSTSEGAMVEEIRKDMQLCLKILTAMAETWGGWSSVLLAKLKSAD